MNIRKFNEKIQEEKNAYLYGYKGDPYFNRDFKKQFYCYYNRFMRTTLRMFEYKNLPETLSARTLERILQGSGKVAIIRVTPELNLMNRDKPEGLYAFPFGWSGVPDENDIPTNLIITNAYFGFSATLETNKNDNVVIFNDILYDGNGGLCSLYASELADNGITLHFQEVEDRMNSIIKADSEDERKDAINVFKDIEDGAFGVFINKEMVENMNKNRVEQFGFSSGSHIKDTLEARQFLLAHWFQEWGMNANYNMKRESLNDGEIDADADTLLPLIDDMLKCRKEGWARANAMYGTNVEVDFSEEWKRIRKRIELTLKKQKAEVEAIEQSQEQPKEDEGDKSNE